MEYEKKYVRINADFTEDGQIKPKIMYWEDGGEFVIDRILDVNSLVSIKVGSERSLRYKVRIQNKERYIWLEGNRWFVEVPII